MTNKVAIIDCGTNTFNLLITSLNNGAFEKHFEEEVSVRIGKGGIENGIITKNAIERATMVFQKFRKILDQYAIPSKNIFAFATSAFRNAQNQQELVTSIQHITGVKIKVIDGREEATLIFNGVSHAIDINEKMLIMDIGGGSVEFILGDSSGILWKQSFEIGAQRLVSLFDPSDPITNQELSNINAYLEDSLSALWSLLTRYQPKTIVGAAGTFESLSHMYTAKLKLSTTLHSAELPFDIDYFDEIYGKILNYDIKKRLEIPGMSSMRVDMIVVASCIVDVVLQRGKFDQFRVSNYALKEGAAFQLFDKVDKTN